MNPRLVEPGFAVACLHADVPARPGKDQDDENEAQGGGRHVEQAGYLHGRPRGKAGDHVGGSDRGRTQRLSGTESSRCKHENEECRAGRAARAIEYQIRCSCCPCSSPKAGLSALEQRKGSLRERTGAAIPAKRGRGRTCHPCPADSSHCPDSIGIVTQPYSRVEPITG